jgi:hypothetical protein
MSYYGFDPSDWHQKLPKNVRFYEAGDGLYLFPMYSEKGELLTASLIALVEIPIPPDKMKILGFKIPYVNKVRKNSDWGPIIDKMLARWNKGVEPTVHGEKMPIVEDLFETPGPRPVEQNQPDAT